MNYLLEQIRNWNACNAGLYPGQETEAIVDAIIQAWGDFGCIEATAREGVAEADSELIAEIIAEYNLDVTVDEAEKALLETCRGRVADRDDKEKDEE